jgi:hypothetical protein
MVSIEEKTLLDNNLQANVELNYQFHYHVRDGQYDLEEVFRTSGCRLNSCQSRDDLCSFNAFDQEYMLV